MNTQILFNTNIQILLFIILLLSQFVVGIAIFCFFRLYSKPITEPRYILLYVMCFSALNYMLSFFGTIVNVISCIVLIFISSVICFRNSVEESVHISSVLTSFLVLSEIISSPDIRAPFMHQSTYYLSIPTYFISKLLMVLIVITCINMLLHSTPCKEIKTSIILSSFPVLSIVLILLLCKAVDHENPFAVSVCKISAFVFIFFNLLVLLVYSREKRLSDEKSELKLQLSQLSADKEYYDLLQKNYDEKQIFIHDINHHLSAIMSLNNSKEISEYITAVNEKYVWNEPELSDNKLLNLILLRYKRKCFEEGILFTADIRKNTVDMFSPDEITSVFENLLSNAFRTVSELNSNDKFIELKAVNREQQKSVLITMVNSANEVKVSQDGRFISTKEMPELHGFGLKSISATIKNHGGHADFYYNDRENTFHSILLVPNSEVK